MSLYKDIKTEILELCGQDAGGDFETEVGRTVNRWYRRILGGVDQDNEHREFTLATVASQSQYGLPLNVKRILNIEDPTAKWPVREMTRTEYDKYLAGTTASGTARRYYQYGVFGSQAKPNSTGVLGFVSSVATDSGNRYIRVSGFDSNNIYRSERVTLTGTTEANTTISFSSSYPIEAITKDNEDGSAITGDITVTDSGANTIAVIPVDMDAVNYRWIEFYPTPDDARNLTVRCIMRKTPLVNDMDWPQFDEDYHGLLVSGPCSDLLPLVGRPTLADQMRVDFFNEFTEFKNTQQRRPNRVLRFRNVTSDTFINDEARIGTVDGVNTIMPGEA